LWRHVLQIGSWQGSKPDGLCGLFVQAFVNFVKDERCCIDW
jgi:hypothetical protein